MVRYFVRRLMVYIPVALLIAIIIFTLSLAAPGDPADWLNNPELELTPGQIEAIRERMGLNDPPHVRFIKWGAQILQGNLGYRLKNNQAIGPLIMERLSRTLAFTGISALFGVIVGTSLGIYTALHQYSWLDYLSAAITFLGISVPAFVLGIAGLWLFGLKLRWFPVGGMSTVGAENSVWDFLYHLILPASMLGVIQVTSYFRYMRMSMLETLHADYLVTARAKGLAQRRVVLVHAVRNALLPLVTMIGMRIPGLLAGAVFLESIFSWPGMGLLFIDGINSRDYPLIMAQTLIMATAVLLANLLTDMAYAIVDPRIRLEARTE